MKHMNSPKLAVDVKRDEKGCLRLDCVWDYRTEKFWTKKQIAERGISWFRGDADMKEILNRNLNGDERKYRFKWVQSGKARSTGGALIFD